jgi:hypothetical protein
MTLDVRAPEFWPLGGALEDGHPIALAKQIVERALAPLAPVLAGIAAMTWDLPIRPEVVLRAVAFMALVDPTPGPLAPRTAGDQQLRWFVGMHTSETALDAHALDEGQRRLIDNLFARQFMRQVVANVRSSVPWSLGQFRENAGVIDAWTSEVPLPDPARSSWLRER